VATVGSLPSARRGQGKKAAAEKGSKAMVLAVSKRNPDGKSIQISKTELEQIRRLDDFDLTMLLSEIDDFGWQRKGNIGGRALLPMIVKARIKG
jgi:hypothetical protein